MNGAQMEGLVLKNYSGFYYVQDNKLRTFECRTRGKLKEQVLTGDRVFFTMLEENKGILEQRLPRKNQLYRPKVANVSMVLVVLAFDRPKPDLTLLDRLLFLAHYSHLTPVIVLNKCDTEPDERIQSILDYYPRCVLQVVTTSTKTETGLDQLKALIAGEIAVLAGPSGVGKSSLLNKLSENESVQTQEVSNKIGRGRHTTRHVELYPISNGGCLVDTPGFSVLDMPAIKREEFIQYFPDFTEYTDDCRFANCIHLKEADCGVKRAIEEHKVLPSRYNNYCSMLEEIIENERCY